MSDLWNGTMPKLGFGLMRLPHNEDKSADIEQIKKMVDAFLAAGMRYFDTAFVYGDSEANTKIALVDRYPRDSYFLVSKLNAWMAMKDADDAKNQINISLERLGTDYLDLYLLHGLSDGEHIDVYEKWGLWDYMHELKAAGKIRHFGFSWHGTADQLEVLLNRHPDTELVQLQVNYADWTNPAVQSRDNLAVCQKHGIPVTIMEPVKGGLLATPPQSVRDIFAQKNPNLSPAGWAIRFAASQPGVFTVLSGMSTIGQMEDNLSYMKNFQPMDSSELDVMAKAQEALAAVDQIACTKCHYCMPGCPTGIHIPDLFEAMNVYKIYGNLERARQRYKGSTEHSPKASECVQCGQCESACPQHLPIITYLQDCAKTLEV
ncbi:MAG: aldo/keto reductase [Lachnospiraceae bacterium]|jgi:predicted aldo/keto reductase-like oxidoreductase